MKDVHIDEKAKLRRLKPPVLVSLALVIGIGTATLFALGAFEGRERSLYDRSLRSTASGRLHRNISVLAVSPGDLDPNGNIRASRLIPIIDGLREAGVTGFAVNEQVAGDEREVHELALKAALHPVAIFSFRFGSSDRSRLERGETPVGEISLPDALTRASTAVAFNERRAGPDRILRRYTPTVSDHPEIGLAVAAAVQPNPEVPGRDSIPGDRRLLGPGPRPLIRFDRDPADANYLVAEDLSDAGIDLRGRTVVIGRVDPGALTWQTPFGEMKDVEVTTQIGSALALGKNITRAPGGIVFAVTVLASLAMMIGATNRHPLLDLALPFAAAIIIWAIAEPSMRFGRWIDSVPLLIVLAAHALSLPVVRYVLRGRNGMEQGAVATRSSNDSLSPVTVAPRSRG